MAPSGDNRCVFSARLKTLSDRSGDRSVGGRRFHVAGPLTVKLRCPVAVRARGTSRVPVAADRRCWQPKYYWVLTLSDPRGGVLTQPPRKTSIFFWKLTLTRTPNPTRSTSIVWVVFGKFSIVFNTGYRQTFKYQSYLAPVLYFLLSTLDSQSRMRRYTLSWWLRIHDDSKSEAFFDCSYNIVKTRKSIYAFLLTKNL